jgi:hypothetical protein
MTLFEDLPQADVKPGRLAFCWYPINSFTNKLDMLYCIPLKIGTEYSTCFLFYGNLSNLSPRGYYSDVCTQDLLPLGKSVKTPAEAATVAEIEHKYSRLALLSNDKRMMQG